MNTGIYGPDYTHGILVDHVPENTTIVFIGGEPHVKEDRERTPILCGDFVEFYDEDGLVHGNCGAPVVKDGRDYGYACAGHTAQREEWQNMSELEKLEWEIASETR